MARLNLRLKRQVSMFITYFDKSVLSFLTVFVVVCLFLLFVFIYFLSYIFLWFSSEIVSPSSIFFRNVTGILQKLQSWTKLFGSIVENELFYEYFTLYLFLKLSPFLPHNKWKLLGGVRDRKLIKKTPKKWRNLPRVWSKNEDC